MKKFAVVLLLTLTLTLGLSAAAGAASQVTVLVNGQPVVSDVPAYIDENGRTKVPVRFVAEALGSEVGWDQSARRVTVKKRTTEVQLWIGKTTYMVNVYNKTMDTAPNIRNGRTMVPLRFIAEALGADVQWDSKTRTVRITTDRGYKVPEGTSVAFNIPPVNDNPNSVDIEFSISVMQSQESQLDDVYSILASKFGADYAKQVRNHIILKTDRWSAVPEKYWVFNGQKVYAASPAGSHYTQVLVWMPGVK